MENLNHTKRVLISKIGIAIEQELLLNVLRSDDNHPSDHPCIDFKKIANNVLKNYGADKFFSPKIDLLGGEVEKIELIEKDWRK